MVSGKVPSGPGVGVSVTEGVGWSAGPAERCSVVASVTESAVGTATASTTAATVPATALRRRWILRARVRTSSRPSGWPPTSCGAVAQLARQQVLLVESFIVPPPRPGRAVGCVCDALPQRRASARLAWDFTVPTEMPRMSATSASLRSS